MGIIVNKMERVLQGKPLRDAIMEVDENTLTWPEGLRMLLDILPNADEVRGGRIEGVYHGTERRSSWNRPSTPRRSCPCYIPSPS